MTIQNVITALSVIISLTTLFTFVRNEINKQRDYGKFLKEIELTTQNVQSLKRALRKVDCRHRQWIEPLENSIRETKGQIHSLDKLTNELFVRLDSISTSIEEIKTIIKK